MAIAVRRTDISGVAHAPVAAPVFRFIDACAGLGGFHMALAAAGGKCVWACETNLLARVMYEVNFAHSAPGLFTGGNFHTDITTADPNRISDFDVLACGFPCQPFTSAGKRLGLHDSRAGVFTHLARILEVRQPRAFLFENVRGLTYRDQRRAFDHIRNTIAGLGYSFHHKILRACDYGVPQYRPRVYLVGFREPETRFTWPARIPLALTLGDVLGGECDRTVARTLLTRVSGKPHGHPGAFDTYLVDGQPHRLTITEIARLQGIPDAIELPGAASQARLLIGNAVAVPVAAALAQQIARALHSGKCAHDARER